ncbi:MAG: GHMP kinase [Anaerolineales bacterium]|nr:GHMP kinase [Anaerolineales bacterium]
MIIVQTPLRVSFFGGGTDFPTFFLAEGGCVLSTAIDKYIFVTLKQRFDRKLRVGYTRTEMVDHLSEIQHDLIREALRQTGITEGIEITTMGDIPSEGSGLGSSSTVTVGALHAAYAYLGELIATEQLAKEACHIEIDRLGNPIGIQDQYIAAYGGLRFLEFTTSGQVLCQRITLPIEQIRLLNQNFLLFFTGLTRQASTILMEQKANIQEHLRVLREMKQITYAAKGILESGELDDLGHLLHESWLLKQQLASRISTPEIDEMYAAARQAGATGGKVSGAGGGGFLLLYCPDGTHSRVRAALSHLQELPFRLEPDGSKVIFNYRRA